MPNSVSDGVRPSAASMRAYSSAVRLCCFSSSGEMLAGGGTAESVLVVMAVPILSHDQTGLKARPVPPPAEVKHRRFRPEFPTQKQRGAISFERAPLAIRILKIWIGLPDHNGGCAG